MLITRTAWRLTAVSLALTLVSCGASAPANPRPSSRPVERDQRLVGKWRVTEAIAGRKHTRADPETHAYVVFTAGGRLTSYDGGRSEHDTWDTNRGRLEVRHPNGTETTLTEFRSEAAVRISTAIGALESSRRIVYEVTSRGLILTGRSRLRGGSPAPSFNILAPTVVHIRYERVN